MPRFEQVESLFHQALALTGEPRRRWLDEHCAENPALLQEVQSLLAANDRMTQTQAIQPVEETIPTARFGAYRAVRLLGRGGMSAVYLAHRADGQFDQTVALKIMASHLADPEFLRRFEIERQLLAALNHQHITRLLDGGVSSAGDPYLITELVQGQTIDRYCDDRKLDVTARLRIFLQVCDAVDYAHRNLIVHRDLKPGNILVNTEGTVKLLDFGTASLMGEQGNPTVTRARMLTPRYASPEQLRGERINTSTDVFSLGVVLYELICGTWPFGDPGSMVSELNRATGEVSAKPPSAAVTVEAAVCRSVSPKQLRTILHGDLSSIVLKALENQPSRRYDSVQQLAADLENFLHGRPVLARRQTVVYRAGKFLRRRWLAAATVAVFVLGLSAASIIALYQAQLARAEARKAQDEAQKSARVTTFLRRMLTSGVAAGGSQVTVLQMLNAAEPGIEKSWQDDPLAEAILRSSLGATYTTLQQRGRANLQTQRALTLFQSLGRHLDAADALWVLAVNGIGESPETDADYCRRALEELKLAGPQASALLRVRVSNYRAAALMELHRVSEARAQVDEAIQYARAPGISPDQLSAALEIRGETSLEEGRFSEAEADFHQAIALNRNAFDAWAMLARSSSLQQNFAAAAGFAHREFELAANDASENRAEAEMWWARYRVDIGEEAEALAQIREAMPEVVKYWRRGYALACHAQPAARVFNKARHFEEAAQYARQALAAMQEVHMPELHPVNAASLEDLGAALCALKNSREGVPALEKAVDLYRRLGPAYANTTTRALVTQASICGGAGL